MNSQDFLQNTIVYLSAAVVMVPLAKRLGLGSVLGYLLAGVLIGPHVLKLVQDVEAILHFAEFGIVLMLFLIGLELRPAKLWELRRAILGMGGLQLFGTIAALTAVIFWLFSFSWQVALLAAMGFTMSSTAIALQILKEKHLLGAESGKASFAVLLFQDIAVIPMLAAIPLLAVQYSIVQDAETASSSPEEWVMPLIAVALLAGGRFALRPLFRVVASTGQREVFTAFSLLVVLGIALIMQKVGLSMALGTFIAGVLMADSEYRHEVEIAIEPFKGLLLGLFFISVGMSLNFDAIERSAEEVGLLLVCLLAVKAVVLIAIAKAFRLAKESGHVFTLSLSQGGEFGFVLFGFGVTTGVLLPEQNTLFSAVIALSMVTTPLFFLLYDRLIVPRLTKGKGAERQADVIETQGPVIIAGFGRFGQVVGRLLHAHHIPAVILEHDAAQIELLRKFGFKVYYGDASRMDLLHAAGAESARLLILAIDDSEQALHTVREVKRHFPKLKIFCRARNRNDVYQLMKEGVPVIVRETFDSALEMGKEALKELGLGAYQAEKAANTFRLHDRMMIQKAFAHLEDEKMLVSIAEAGRKQLADIISEEYGGKKRSGESDW
jgi:glutathione-regulated potassium-efflux system ancillary protein KefC